MRVVKPRGPAWWRSTTGFISRYPGEVLTATSVTLGYFLIAGFFAVLWTPKILLLAGGIYLMGLGGIGFAMKVAWMGLYSLSRPRPTSQMRRGVDG